MTGAAPDVAVIGAGIVGVSVAEAEIPVLPEVTGACELLGIDPMYVANEGVMVAFVAPEVADEALAALRIEETAKAAALLGFAGTRHLDYPDGELEDSQELRAAIVRVIREVRPDAVLCPDPTAVFFGDGYYNNRDHRTTGWATLDAVAPAEGGPPRPGEPEPALTQHGHG